MLPAERTILSPAAAILTLVSIAAPASGQTVAAGNRVFSWGSNTTTPAGSVSGRQTHTLERIAGLGEVLALAGCGDHSLALQSDGTVWTWGEDATSSNGSAPVRVRGLRSVTAVACGSAHNIALR